MVLGSNDTLKLSELKGAKPKPYGQHIYKKY